MKDNTHQLPGNGIPVHPRIVRYVVAAFLFASLVRVCLGSADGGGSDGGPHFLSGGPAANPAEH